MTSITKSYTLLRNTSFFREGDNERREEFDRDRTMLGKMETNPHFLDSICFSDESTFHTSSRLVHRHNVRKWGNKNANTIRQVEMASPKVNVWCGLFIDTVISPYFFRRCHCLPNQCSPTASRKSHS